LPALSLMNAKASTGVSRVSKAIFTPLAFTSAYLFDVAAPSNARISAAVTGLTAPPTLPRPPAPRPAALGPAAPGAGTPPRPRAPAALLPAASTSSRSIGFLPLASTSSGAAPLSRRYRTRSVRPACTAPWRADVPSLFGSGL
jgi:hypothetical protein